MQKILIADDDSKILTTMERHLKRAGYMYIDTVTSGKQAIDQLKKNKYDVIISDYQMENGNGFSVLKNNVQDLPFILITGCLDNKVSTQFVNNDAFRIIEKPFEMNDLEKAVEQAMTKNRNEVEKEKHVMMGKKAGHILHDINNQLQIMDMSSDIGERASDNDKQKTNFKRIKKAVGITADIVKSYKKINKAEIKYQEFDAIEFLRDIHDSYCHGFKNKFDIDFSVNAPDEKVHVTADRLLLTQVFDNIISNARDAIKSEEEKWIKLNVEVQNRNLVIEIHDSGYVEESKRNCFFVEGFTTKGSEGTGKGLFYCKSIVEMHLGKISTPEADNTVFRIELPISK